MVKKSYILVNGNMAYAKGISWYLNLNEEDLVSFGYEKLETAKGALRRLKKINRFDPYFGYLNGANWKIITVQDTFSREIK